MTDLETVMTRVEQVPLPSDTRQRHLAELLRAQSALADDHGTDDAGQHTDPPAAIVVGPSRTRTRSLVTSGLAAAAVVIVAGGGWLLSGHPAPQQIPVAGSAPSSTPAPSETVKLLPANETAATTGSKRPPTDDNILTSTEAIQRLAADLGVSSDRAASALKQLVDLTDSSGSLDPGSPGFAGVASSLGVTPERLNQGLIHIKKSLDPALAAGQSNPAIPNKTGQITGTKVATSDQQNLLTSPAAIKLLATKLGVTQDQAAAAANRLVETADANGGLDPRSADFAAVASSLRVTPAKLADALGEVKRGG